jgi:hypothetical protein
LSVVVRSHTHTQASRPKLKFPSTLQAFLSDFKIKKRGDVTHLKIAALGFFCFASPHWSCCMQRSQRTKGKIETCKTISYDGQFQHDQRQQAASDTQPTEPMCTKREIVGRLQPAGMHKASALEDTIAFRRPQHLPIAHSLESPSTTSCLDSGTAPCRLSTHLIFFCT